MTAAQTINGILANVANKPLATITPETELDALEIESLDFVEIITEMEVAFDLVIMDEDIVDLKTVGDIYRLIEQMEREK